MLRRKITTSGNSAALILSQDLLGLMGVKVGDEVEVEVQGNTLLIHPIDEERRSRIVREAFKKVMKERGGLFERLARGDGTPKPKSKEAK
jgi:antitoxin component of MazEF toxin-antitoxin module